MPSDLESKAAAFELLAKAIVAKMPPAAQIKKLAGIPFVEAIKDYVFVPHNRAMAWHPVTEPVPERLRSTAMEYVPLLLAFTNDLCHYPNPVRGHFLGGRLNVFRVDGSPSDQEPTHWMEMPPMP